LLSSPPKCGFGAPGTRERIQIEYFCNIGGIVISQISIIEDGELKDIIDCKEGTIKNWLYKKKNSYIRELVILLLKELRDLKKKI